MFRALSRLLALPLLLLVYAYRVLLSPFLGINCRFQPTCSEYTIEALKSHGIFRGTMLAFIRIGKCHPWGASGYDPVPGIIDAHAHADPGRLRQKRKQVLNHAYGFVSRGNRAGGLQHIYDWLHEDPEPVTAWPWFFEQMLRWEDNEGALVFAQRYLGELLHDGQQVQAVKLLLRARLANESFRPLAEDLPLAIDAADTTGNGALGDALRRL